VAALPRGLASIRYALETEPHAAPRAVTDLDGGNALLTWTEVWAYTDGDLPAMGPMALA
jgi:hypothetical protein